MEKSGGHAVVLGASMGGLLAARVLADFYDRVTVVERDVLPSDPVNRRGVPQGRMIHAALARCTQILDELFPGFVDELAAMGVESWDDGDLSKLWLSVGGHQPLRSGRAPNAPVIWFPSRPSLEWNVRRRVKAITNVMFLEGHDLVGLTATPDRHRVTGAWVVDRAADRKKALRADLVVDATGRGSRTPVFLEELGYGRPPEDELTVQLAYACQLLRITPGAVKEHMIALFPEPGRPKMFGLTTYENDTWMFGVGTLFRSCACAGSDSNGRASGRGGSPSRSIQPLAALRQDAPDTRRSAGRRRRGLQLQPHLRARHDVGGDRGDGAA